MKKNIIITGGSRGIGQNMVEEFAKKGNNILLNYNKSESEAKNIALKLKHEGCNVEIYKADITNRTQVNKMVDFFIDKYKKVDVLINNAGISQIKMFTDLTDEDWNNMIDVNLTGAFNVTQEVVKKSMINNKNGCIINISSIWGVKGSSCEVHYSAAKSGLIGMTKALAKELGLSNIRVNCIAPGFIDTQMNKDISAEDLNIIKQEIPLNKIGYPQNITKCAQWLIEDEYTTGQVVCVDGGWSIN